MKIKLLLISSLLITFIILTISISAQSINNQENLKLGKNNITTPSTFNPIYVKDFINFYPEIEVISFKENNKTIGYINTFNGIGDNFVIYPEKKYEIIAKQNITIYLQ